MQMHYNISMKKLFDQKYTAVAVAPTEHKLDKIREI